MDQTLFSHIRPVGNPCRHRFMQRKGERNRRRYPCKVTHAATTWDELWQKYIPVASPYSTGQLQKLISALMSVNLSFSLNIDAHGLIMFLPCRSLSMASKLQIDRSYVVGSHDFIPKSKHWLLIGLYYIPFMYTFFTYLQ